MYKKIILIIFPILIITCVSTFYITQYSKKSFNALIATDAAACITKASMRSGGKVYKNKEYNVSLKYNKDWKANNKNINRYEGEDGFFQISAYNGQNLGIDEVADNEANHKLKPYGSKPQISKLVVQGQEARLIMPSEDQPAEENNAAEVIIKYPKGIKISGDMYFYLIVNADKGNINKIINTIKFIN